MTTFFVTTLLTLLFAAAALGATDPDSTAVKPVSPMYKTLATGLNFPEGPSLSPDGRWLYCVNVRDADISRIDLKTGEFKKDWVVLPSPGRGNGSTIGPDGALYIADVGRKCIDRIDRETSVVSLYLDHNETGEALQGPNDLCFDHAGNLYFTDPEGSSATHPIGAAYVFSPKANSVVKISGGLRYPNGIIADRDGMGGYFAETPRGVISVFGRIQKAIAPPPGAPLFACGLFCRLGGKGGPDGMRADRHGDLYVAMYGGGEIVKIDPHGVIVKRYTVAAGSNPTNLCFSKDGKRLYITETESNSVIEMRI